MEIPASVQEELLRILLEVGPQGATAVELEKIISFERHTLSKYLMFLKGQGFVNYKKVGKAKVWFVDKAPFKTILNSSKEKRSFTEQILSNLISTIPLGVVVVDLQYKIQFMNKLMIEKYGDQTTKLFYEVILGKDNPLSISKITQLIENNEEVPIVLLVKDKNHNILEIHVSKLINPDKSEAVILLIDDVTKRTKIEEERQLLLNLTQKIADVQDFFSAVRTTLQEISHLGGWDFAEAWIPSNDATSLVHSNIFFYKTNHVISMYNATKNLSFKKKEEWLGKVWASQQSEWINHLILSAPSSMFYIEIAKRMKFNAIFAVPIVVDRKVLAILVFFAKQVREKDEDFVQLVSAVTKQLGFLYENKRLEEENSKQRRRLEAKKEALNRAAIVEETDLNGIITYANENFSAISGYTTEELLGKTHSIVNSSYHSKEFFHDMWNTIVHGKVWHGLIRNKKKKGTFYWVDTTIAPILDETGKPERYLAIRFEVTKYMENQG